MSLPSVNVRTQLTFGIFWRAPRTGQVAEVESYVPIEPSWTFRLAQRNGEALSAPSQVGSDVGVREDPDAERAGIRLRVGAGHLRFGIGRQQHPLGEDG